MAGETWNDFYKRIDTRLYAAKTTGRNKSVGDQLLPEEL